MIMYNVYVNVSRPSVSCFFNTHTVSRYTMQNMRIKK